MPESFSAEVPPSRAASAPRRRYLAPLLGALLIVIGTTGWLVRLVSQQPTHTPPPDRPIANAPYIKTPSDVLDRMLELAELTKDDVLYDLGSGDGRIVIAGCKQSGCRGVGVEFDPKLVVESRRNASDAGVGEQVTIVEGDVFKTDLTPATAILFYLLPKQIEALIPQFEQCRPGTRLVSHDFDMAGVEPERRVRMRSQETGETHVVYLWKTPLRRGTAPDAAAPKAAVPESPAPEASEGSPTP